jgi:hypothetical protein
MEDYREQLQKGAIQVAYRGLMAYMMSLRTHFTKAYPEYRVSGSIYYGYMDMTYFSVVPDSFKQRKLKIAIVFLHEAFRFEAWLAANNKGVQSEYWKRFKESKWNKYHIVQPAKGVDSIVEHVLVEEPNFGDLDTLTNQCERETLKFTKDIESFISNFEM